MDLEAFSREYDYTCGGPSHPYKKVKLCFSFINNARVWLAYCKVLDCTVDILLIILYVYSNFTGFCASPIEFALYSSRDGISETCVHCGQGGASRPQ